MRPAAQLQTAIELMDEWLAAPSAMDRALQQYFRSHRYIGSKDRKAIQGHIYRWLRDFGALQWQVEQRSLPLSGRTIALADLAQGQSETAWFNGETYAPSPLREEETKALDELAQRNTNDMPAYARANLPEWLYSKLCAQYESALPDLLEALAQEAPLDLRCNKLKATREQTLQSLKAEGIEAEASPHSPWGLRIHQRKNIQHTKAFQHGWVEIQDEASQLAALHTGALPGETILDYCAGAGGKALAMAAMMQNEGRILATDTHEHRMQDIVMRAKRAGTHIIDTMTINNAGLKKYVNKCDRVLIDAPCSGSGTWRRSPDLRWRISPQKLNHLCDLQKDILNKGKNYVKPGGQLIYVTCSILKEENDQQLAVFLRNSKDFRLLSTLNRVKMETLDEGLGKGQATKRFLPHVHATDGFFCAVLTRKS